MSERKQWTRRDLVAALGVGGLGAFVGGRYFDQGSPEQFHYVDVEQFGEGFSPIEQDHPIWKDLITPETRIALGYKEAPLHGHGRYFKKEYFFTVDDDSTALEVNLAVAPTPDVAAKPFLAILDDGTEFFLPFVQSVRPSSVTAYLGKLGKGEHALQLNEDPSDYPLGTDVLVGLSSVSGTPLQNYLRDTQPRYAIRADNIGDMTNDMPLFEVTEVLRRAFDNELLLQKTVIYTSEDSGLSPTERLRRYGRTEDIEPSVHQKVQVRKVVGYPGEEIGFLPKDQKSYQAIVQVPGRKTPHGWAQFDGTRKNGQPLLQIKTDNNLLSEKEETNIFFAPPPTYGLGENTANKLLQVNPEWNIISLEEEASAVFYRTLFGAGRMADKDMTVLQRHPYGSYPTTNVLLAS